MTVAAPAAPARLNVFAFPSDTGVRFILLLVTLFSASLFVYRSPFLAGRADPYGPCMARAYASGQFSSLNGSAIPCPAGEWMSATGAIAATAALGGIAFLVYLLMPAWTRWRAGFTPVAREDAAEIIATVTAMADQAGVARPPLLVWNPLSPSASAIAFGAWGRYIIGLHGGLVTRWSTDREGFLAVIRHELAHIKNGDIDRTYLTVASWWAFLLAALVPFTALSLLWDRGSILGEGIRAAALAFLVYVIRNAVLRARENYADVRASVWDGPNGALRRVIAALPRSKDVFSRLHPRPDQRLRVLDDTSLLFPVASSDAFLTGVVGSVAVTNLTNTVAALTLRGNLHYDIAFVAVALAQLIGPGLLLGVLTIGVVGSGVWRVSFALLAGRRVHAGVLRLAIAIGLGMLVGHLLGFQVPGEAGGFDPVRLAAAGLWLIICTVAFVGGMYLILRWTMSGALAWLGRLSSERTLRLATWIGVALAAVLAAGWFGLVVVLRDSFEALLLLQPADAMAKIAADAVGAAGALLGLVLGTPIGIGALMVSLAWPLAAVVGRPPQTATDWRWGFLNLGPQEAAAPPANTLQVAGIVRIALPTAAVYIVMLSALAAARAAGLLSSISQQAGLAVIVGLVAAAVLLQALAAAIVAFPGGAFAGVRGLLTSFVAGWPIAAAQVVFIAWLTGLDVVVSVLTACLVVNCGAVLSLLAGVPLGVLVGRLR